MSRHLIVNADDFGHTPGVAQGIIRAHREGIVTSTTVMVNKPAAAEAIRLAQQDAPELGLGLHFNLTAGRPISAAQSVPDLVQADDAFRCKDSLIPALPTMDMTQVERELRAQVDHFVRLAGRAPDHLDSHHHITYLSPAIAGVMLKIAGELNAPIRNPIPYTGGVEFMLDVVPTHNPEDAQKAIDALKSILMQSRVRMPDHFIGDFYDERATLGDLLNLLFDVPVGVSELMCHPAIVDDALRASSSYSDRRGDEFAALTHPSARELLKSQGIKLISFGGLSG